LACEREGIDMDEIVVCVLHLLEGPNSEPCMVEWEKIGQDWTRLMENSARGGMSKGIMLAISGTRETNNAVISMT
jgi:hypothetical protein